MKLILVTDAYDENQSGVIAIFRNVERKLATHDDAWVGSQIRDTATLAANIEKMSAKLKEPV